jgi:hypothetical protein
VKRRVPALKRGGERPDGPLRRKVHGEEVRRRAGPLRADLIERRPPRAWSRQARTTVAPDRAKFRAARFPMPELAPVTTHTLPRISVKGVSIPFR